MLKSGVKGQNRQTVLAEATGSRTAAGCNRSAISVAACSRRGVAVKAAIQCGRLPAPTQLVFPAALDVGSCRRRRARLFLLAAMDTPPSRPAADKHARSLFEVRPERESEMGEFSLYKGVKCNWSDYIFRQNQMFLK